LLEGDGNAVIEGVGDDEVVQPVAVKVGGGNPLWQAAGADHGSASEGRAGEVVNRHRVAQSVAGADPHASWCTQQRDLSRRATRVKDHRWGKLVVGPRKAAAE